jgi:hypothetical protein
MIVRDLIANHGHDIGHRRLVRDEVWCRMEFRSDADLIAFCQIAAVVRVSIRRTGPRERGQARRCRRCREA